MNDLIDALLEISRLSHAEPQRAPVNLSQMAGDIVNELRQEMPERAVVFAIQPQVRAQADPGMVRIALNNLLDNAWKFTRDAYPAVIEFGSEPGADGEIFFVRDNGAGFAREDCDKLFHPFQRLHDPREYAGNGMGLMAVKRVVERHGGKAWAEGEPGKGATFYFTLPS